VTLTLPVRNKAAATASNAHKPTVPWGQVNLFGVVGSVHSPRRASDLADAADRYADPPDAEVVRQYLAEVTVMVQISGSFPVLAHISHAARHWPGRPGDRTTDFEGEYRAALHALASTGRVLEINQRRTARRLASAATHMIHTASAGSWPARQPRRRPQDSVQTATDPVCGAADRQRRPARSGCWLDRDGTGPCAGRDEVRRRRVAVTLT
jgi:hypothetical protein